MMRKAALLLVLSAALASFPTAASANMATMNLSSWQADTVEGAIVGGTQSVTVTNVTSEQISDVVFTLSERPCDCDIVDAAPSSGILRDDAWVIPNLDPGETATLSIQYRRAPASTAAAIQRFDPLIYAVTAVLAGMLVAATRGRSVAV